MNDCTYVDGCVCECMSVCVHVCACVSMCNIMALIFFVNNIFFWLNGVK